MVKNSLCLAGGSFASIQLLGSQTGVGYIQRIRFDYQELHQNCDRHSWWMVSSCSLVFNLPWEVFFYWIKSLAFVMGWICRLVDVAPHYYDLINFPNCEAKRVLEKLYKKREREKAESKNRKWMIISSDTSTVTILSYIYLSLPKRLLLWRFLFTNWFSDVIDKSLII